MMKIECVIFDCDGLMFDTETISTQCWRAVAQRHNIVLDDEFFYKIIGSGKKNFAEVMVDHQDLLPYMEEIRANRVSTIMEAAKKIGSINKKGLVELLDYLDLNHYKKAVASSSHRSYVENLLSSIGRDTQFDGIVCGDEVVHGKPDPEIFLTAAKKAGIAPENCVVLEDSKFGILAAKAAGMHSVFIYDMVQPDTQMQNAIQSQGDSLLDVIEFLKENGK